MIGKCPHCGMVDVLWMGGGATHGWCVAPLACDYRYAIRQRHEFPDVASWAWTTDTREIEELPF